MRDTTRTWGYALSAEELRPVREAGDEFRIRWAAINPPWPHSFDGTVKDALAIDYLHYEGLEFPKCGIEGAALVCGEVLRRSARLEWVCSHRGNWVLASPEDMWSQVVISPLARVDEIQFAGTPQFGRFSRFLVRAAIDAFPFVASGAQDDLRQLVVELHGEDEIVALETALQELRPPG